MYTIAFIGASGTGKSYRAVMMAGRFKADAIIDDGLLIAKNKVLAGFSAKKESTKIAAVKRALFTKEEHVLAVKKAIRENEIKRILVLGTSLRMVNKIAVQLGIYPIDEVIRIEEVASPSEIAEARKMRSQEGKHIIPVPVPEIKRDFSGYFLHPIKSKMHTQKARFDKSIIRPTFSYMGAYSVSDSAICEIAAYEAKKVESVARVNSVQVFKNSNGASINISLSMRMGTVIPAAARLIQKSIIDCIDNMTSINVTAVNLYVKRLL